MVKLLQIGDITLFRKFLIPFIALFFTFGCDDGTTQLLEEQQNNGNEELLAAVLQEEMETTNNEINGNDDENTNQHDQTSSNTVLEELTVHFIDAGQADATLFQFADQDKNYTILYDTGDWKKNDVVNYLHEQQIEEIDLIIVSHPHADHIGQLAEILRTFTVGEVWLSGSTASSQTFQKAVEAIMASDADYHEPRRGETFEVGPMEIEVLHPDSLSGDLNEDSIALRFIYGDMKFVVTGDAYQEQELSMMQSSMEVDATILRLGHHGSNTSSSQAFLQAVDPEVAIYSAGQNNSYGHPHDEVIERVQELDISLYGTDVHGTIVVITDGNSYDILTKEDGTISPVSTVGSGSPDVDQQQSVNEPPAEANDGCIDINHASLDELQQIIHIGPERAQELVDLRPFNKVDDLTRIKGIGNARIADIKEQGLACVGG